MLQDLVYDLELVFGSGRANGSGLQLFHAAFFFPHSPVDLLFGAVLLYRILKY